MRLPMTKILVLYYSSYGHIEQMAQAVADGARESGADVVIKRVPEIVPPNVAGAYGFKLDQAAPIAVPDELADYDGIVFGVPTRFGGMAEQMRNFLDQTGGLWHRGALIGKVARSAEHTSELQSLLRNSYAVFCLNQHITHEEVLT